MKVMQKVIKLILNELFNNNNYYSFEMENIYHLNLTCVINDFRFVFLNDKKDSSLSLTVTPCMSILKWSVSYLEVNGK